MLTLNRQKALLGSPPATAPKIPPTPEYTGYVFGPTVKPYISPSISVTFALLCEFLISDGPPDERGVSLPTIPPTIPAPSILPVTETLDIFPPFQNPIIPPTILVDLDWI